MTLRPRSRILVAIMRPFSNASQCIKPGVDISANSRDMIVCVKMTFAALRGHEQGNTRMLAYEVIEVIPIRKYVNHLKIGYHLAELGDVKDFGHFRSRSHLKVTR